MVENQLKSQVNFSNKNLTFSQIATFIILIFPPLGGLFYIAGSTVYWPSLQNINPYTGGGLFTFGSILLVMTDIAGAYLQPDFSMLRPLKNVGAFRSLCLLIGNLAFTIGSVFFLPGFPVIIGEDLFLIASIFQFIPQIIGIWGVVSLNIYTAQFYVKMVCYKKTIILMNLCLAGGCFCFFTGTFLFQHQNQESLALNQQAVMLFIVGSFFYLIGPLCGFKMRKLRILDPLTKYHEQIHEHFLPKAREKLLPLQKKTNSNTPEQFLILKCEPSIQMTFDQPKIIPVN